MGFRTQWAGPLPTMIYEHFLEDQCYCIVESDGYLSLAAVINHLEEVQIKINCVYKTNIDRAIFFLWPKSDYFGGYSNKSLS